jgi:hypothetical protein
VNSQASEAENRDGGSPNRVRSHAIDGGARRSTTLEIWPESFLLYANRSRGDMLRGGFGGLKRNAAQSQARKAAQETLGTIKRQLKQ